MDIEQLKLILEMLKTTAEDAEWLFITYLVFTMLVKPLICMLGWFSIAFLVYKGVTKIVAMAYYEDDIKSIRSTLELPHHYPIDSSSMREVAEKIYELKHTETLCNQLITEQMNSKMSEKVEILNTPRIGAGGAGGGSYSFIKKDE